MAKRKTNQKRLTFEAFQALNSRRCDVAFPMCWDWTLNDWAVALAGESGELCNLLKKIKRGDLTVRGERQALLAELADIMTYCDLMMTKLGASTADEIQKKFAEVSQRVGFKG